MVAGEFLRRWLESLVILDSLVCGLSNGLLSWEEGLSPN